MGEAKRRKTMPLSLTLCCKLGSILVHVEEGSEAGGHEFDWAAAKSLMSDPEVQEWLQKMRTAGFLPLKRSG